MKNPTRVLFRVISGSGIQGLHGDGCDEASEHNTGKTEHHRQRPTHAGFGREVAVADGEPCNIGEVERFADPPSPLCAR